MTYHSLSFHDTTPGRVFVVVPGGDVTALPGAAVVVVVVIIIPVVPNTDGSDGASVGVIFVGYGTVVVIGGGTTDVEADADS